MVSIKSVREIELMKLAGAATGAARDAACAAVAPGVSTADIDAVVRDKIKEFGATPSFLGYNGYPAAACVSINDEVIHGIPSRHRKIHNGDIVKVDVGAILSGYQGDCAATVPVGDVAPEVLRLVETTRGSFFAALKVAKAGNRLSDIGRAVQKYAEDAGFSVVRDYTGHGIGTEMHEDPEVPNYWDDRMPAKLNHLLVPGMTIAIEPMVNLGTYAVRVKPDGWTVVTKDGKPSAHYEHTVLITSGEPLLLTK